jgi:radical SAM superfamily enzyme YgiQ (UPF0313 family)
VKILLVSPRRPLRLAAPPSGLGYLVPPLEAAGHEVAALDLMYETRPLGRLERVLGEREPDVVGLSVARTDALGEIREMVSVAKRSGAVTVVGGPAFTPFAAEILDATDADYGIAGQGEDSLVCLVACIEEDRFDPSIPGITWRQGGHVRTTSPAFGGYAGKTPDWEALDLRPYRRSTALASVVTKTGCAYACTHCDAKVTFGGVHPREPAAVAGEIEKLAREKDARVLYLSDPCFNSPLAHAKAVLEAILKTGVRAYLYATLVPVHGHYDDELFTLFARAGGRMIHVPADALSGEMLASYQKPFGKDDVVTMCEMARRHGICVGLETLFGGPGENDATVGETLEALGEVPYSVWEHHIGVRVMPRTALAKTAREAGLYEDNADLLRGVRYVSSDLDVAWAEKAIRDARAKHRWRALGMAPLVVESALARWLGVVT